MQALSRRRMLRGILDGSTVTVGLPLLDCFLNGNGTALASGEPRPVRFGTWFWGLGWNKQIAKPKKLGANYDVPEEIECLAPLKQHINVFSDFNVFLDSNPNACHHTGWIILRSGACPLGRTDYPGQTIDVPISRKIGGVTRFRALTATATGDARDGRLNYEDRNSVPPVESSPLEFYQRLFGPDFQDPNSPTWAPNPRVMVQKSVLSAVGDSLKSVNATVGAEDRARIDQYATALRELERQFDQQLRKPDPIAACIVPKAPKDPSKGQDSEILTQRHKLMTQLLAMAVMCDQTRVINMIYTNPFARTGRTGLTKDHHVTTHEEPVDPQLGYQPISSWFARRSMESWRDFVQTFADIREGDGTLLDSMLIFAHSDVSFARTHSLDGIPMFTAGRAGGRVKTGLHISGAGTQGTRLGYTALRVMGVDVPRWGAQSNETSKELGEILV